MVVLYVVSAEEAAGKTAICAGLGSYLRGAGRQVGFLKLLVTEKNGADGDAAFMQRVLDLPEAVESPGSTAGDAKNVKETVDRVSQGKDVVIVEGMLVPASGEFARALNARVIIVEAYPGASGYLDGYKGFGESLLGVVLNKVPASQLPRVRADAPARFGAAGINVLGALPEDRALFAITVGELAAHIQGRILNNDERAADLVENFMLGAMVVDSGLDYFGRKSRKAAVISQNRPDMQMAALETSTRCLILSGSSEPPIYSVLEKAESRGIPIIATETATADIIAGIEDALSSTRFHQEEKLSKLAGMMQQHLDLPAVL